MKNLQLIYFLPGKIAFSVGLTRPVGPYDIDTAVKYNKVFTIVGCAFDTALCKFKKPEEHFFVSIAQFHTCLFSFVFAAPVNGVYYFHFTAFEYGDGKRFGVQLHHNYHRI